MVTETADVFSAISKATARAAGSNSSGSWILRTNPASWASCASNTLPLYAHSRALLTPTARGRKYEEHASGTITLTEHESDPGCAGGHAYVHRQCHCDSDPNSRSIDRGNNWFVKFVDPKRKQSPTVTQPGVLAFLSSSFDARSACAIAVLVVVVESFSTSS